jgi:hypothetical protein
MPEFSLIPMFPLTLLPLPGELVPLHIFEPRYKQLLNDVEAEDIGFGIYCNHDFNSTKLGSFMKLESVIKRYPSGESDIIVRCVDIFMMDKLYRSYLNKMYPGGDVLFQRLDLNEMPQVELYELFLVYQSKRNINRHIKPFTTFEIAHELNLDLYDRYKFLLSTSEKRESFLESQLKFQIHVLRQEEKSKDVFHLN